LGTCFTRSQSDKKKERAYKLDSELIKKALLKQKEKILYKLSKVDKRVVSLFDQLEKVFQEQFCLQREQFVP
jgi:hypothetical protein